VRVFKRVRQWFASEMVAVPWVLPVFLLAFAVIFPISKTLADEELDFGLETHRLERIELSGNETFDDTDLKDVLRIQERTWSRPLNRPKYSPHLMDTQIALIRNYYRNRGFHQVFVRLDSISTVPEKGDVLHIAIEEGPRTLIRSVEFSNTEILSESQLRQRMTLLEGKPAPMSLNTFGFDIYAIRALFRDLTFLDASVSVSMVIFDNDDNTGYLADVKYQINPGRPYFVRSITLSGNRDTKDRLLTRELVIHPGDPMRWNKVEDSRRQLLVTSLFRDVEILPTAVDSAAGLADLEVKVVERKPAYYELGVGVGSRERIRLLAAWGHKNIRGTGRRVEVRGRGSWNLEDVVGNPISFDQGQINYRADIQYVNPRLRDSRYSFDTEIYLKRETRGESALNQSVHGFNLGSTWRASRRVTNSAHVGIKITNPSVHPYAPDSLKVRFDEVDVDLTQTRFFNFSNYIDKRNDLFHPSGGMYTIGTIKLAGGVLGGDYSFLKGSASWQNYHAVPIGGVLALRFMVGAAAPYGKSAGLGSDGVPYDDRFFAGGASSVRGYGHNSLGPQVTDQDELDELNYGSDVLLPDNPARGGNYLMLTNLEWRFPLPLLSRWNFASVMFFEGGNVWEDIGDIRMKGFRLISDPGEPNDPGSTKAWDYRYSYGTGIRLDTPFGPVRADVGIPLKRVRYLSQDKDYSDPKVVWHFSLGYPF
jgi:outer membrane protein insertion porin family